MRADGPDGDGGPSAAPPPAPPAATSGALGRARAAWRRPELRLALSLLPVCFILAMVGRGTGDAFVVFVLPLQEAFGWSRGEVAGIYSFYFLSAGAFGPVVGHVFDRFGPFWLFLGCILLLSGGALLASQADALWQFYLTAGLMMGIASAGLGTVPHGALLSRWYRARLGVAVALVFSSVGVGSLVFAPLAQRLVIAEGWSHAYMVLGGIALLPLILVAAMPWRRIAAGRPDIGLLPPPRRDASGAERPVREWTVGAALRTRQFWGLFLVFVFTGNGMFSLALQAVAYLVESGIPQLEAATAWGFVGLLTPIGMNLFGWLDRIIGRLTSVMLSYGLSLVAVVALRIVGWDHQPVLLYLFVVLFGLSFGARGPLIAAICTRLFAGRRLGAIYGTVTLGGGLGAASGSAMGGLLHDVTGGYDAVFVYAFAMLCLGTLPFWLVDDLARERD